MTTTATTRRDRLVGELEALGVDLLLVTDLISLRYLTGYTGSNGIALIGPETRLFVTDFRYLEQSAQEVDPGFERIIASQDLIKSLPELLPGGSLTLGFDDAHTSVLTHRTLLDSLPGKVELKPAGGLIERLRRVKDPGEIEAIAAATQVADQAFEAVVGRGLIGRTERDVALALEHEMRLLGADGPSFSSIIAAGGHGALPHAQPRNVVIEAKQLVVIDWGAYMAGYCSDCTRTVATGEISPVAKDAYELVLHAQLSALDAIKTGADTFEVDRVARDIIGAAGHAEHYGHGLGHGVGLEIHEAPTLTFRLKGDQLLTGDVVTVEPGVYLPGEFGIRIEDLTVVHEDGPQILTGIPKQLRVVG